MAERTHTVKRGETLGGIARRYGVGVAALAKANGIRDVNRVRAGVMLRLPPKAGAVAPRAMGGTATALDATGGKAVASAKASKGEPAWLRVARGEVGVKEVPGAADNARVVEYHACTTLRASHDAVPWCAAFVGWCLRESGHAGTGSAAARSYARWGVALDAPRVGAVVVLSRGTGAQGHVGFAVGWTNEAVDVLGGNQGDRVSVARFRRDRVLAWRWPGRDPRGVTDDPRGVTSNPRGGEVET